MRSDEPSPKNLSRLMGCSYRFTRAVLQHWHDCCLIFWCLPLYAAAKLGISDLLERGLSTAAELASELKAHEESLYRTLRALASREVFEESAPRTFRNSQLSRSLRTGEPGSIRPLFLLLGTEFY